MAIRSSHDNATINALFWINKNRTTHRRSVVLYVEGTRYFLTATEARTLADSLHDAADKVEQ